METDSGQLSDLASAITQLEGVLAALKAGLPSNAFAREVRIGTMGPLTCSAEALTAYLFVKRLPAVPIYSATFDEVVASLLRGDIDQALVPHCHPIASQILFDDRFDVAMDDAFDKPNPPLYLAVRNETHAAGGRQAGRCAALPTLWPLVAHDERELTLVPVVSNPAAARALRDGEVDYAITNEASLAAFGLHSLRPLKHVIVRWLPVRRRGDAIVPGRMPALDGAARASDGVESSLRRSP